MTHYVQKMKICEITDSGFQSMVDELSLCIGLDREHFNNQPLAYMLMVIHKEKKALTRHQLPISGILTTKVDKLPPDSVVDLVCRELVNLKKTHIESFDGKTVLSLIKHCHKALCPLPPKTKRLTRRQSAYQFKADLIKRRRVNGDL